MALLAFLAKFVKLANLAIQTIRTTLQLLQFAVLVASALFSASQRGRHATV